MILHHELLLFTDSKEFENFVDSILDGNISEVDLSDDEDDLDVDPSFVPEDIQPETSDSDSDTELVLQGNFQVPSQSSTSGNASNVTPDRYRWRKIEDFSPNPPAPEYESQPINALNLPPQDYISKYLPDSMFGTIVEQSNRTYLAKTGRNLDLTKEELKKFFSATLLMSILKFPRIKMYWERKTKVNGVASLIGRDRYFTIRSHLKVVYDTDITNEEKNQNKFWKVAPLLNSVRTGCLLNPKSETVAVDEQMIPFFGQTPARQVIKSKPNPCGLKNFVIAAPDGLPLDFFFYQGKGDPIVEDDRFHLLDVGGKAVIKLLATFPTGVAVYMDRYFNSMHLLDLLHSEAGATGTGTLMKNRIPTDSKLKSDKDLKKQGRGSTDQSVRSDGQISIVKWFDKKPVILMSSKEGMLPVDQCRRWCRKTKQYLMVDRPLIVKEYNSKMGGIDLLDRFISYYRMAARTKKWTIRVIMHMIDFSIAAGWIEYKRDQTELGTRKRDILDLIHFREEYAQYLAYGTLEVSEDEDADFECTLPAPRKKPRVSHPPDVLRTKHTLHLPEIPSPATKNRCRLPGCSANTARVKCTTCGVFLCIQENRNCFQLYHEL